jgi:ABC-type siderophore export system fused ATPase/permease subunit
MSIQTIPEKRGVKSDRRQKCEGVSPSASRVASHLSRDARKEFAMPLIQVLLVLVVVGVLLWLVNLIPMQSTIKSILNSVVVIFVVIWLLNIFGLMPYLSRVRVGNYHL